MVKQKSVEKLQITEKSGRIPPISRKGSCKIKMTGYTEGVHQFQKQATKMYEVIFFDMQKYVKVYSRHYTLR